MAHQDDCIFCKIIAGEIPSHKIYEDDDILAFLDISQVTKGHTLVIPKDHQENIYELKSDTASKLFKVVPQIAGAVKEAFDPSGMNLLNNNGEIAGQTVFHYHLHILPRYDNDVDGFELKWETHMDAFDDEEKKSLADAITAKMKSLK